MAKCKLCRRTIPDGAEYCDECIEKKDFIDSESYLDSLLNSVQGETTSASDIYKKKKEADDKEESLFSVDTEDLDDFDLFDISKDLDSYLGNDDDDAQDNTGSNDTDISKQFTEEDTDTSTDIEQGNDLESNNIDNEFLQTESQDVLDEYEEGNFDPALDDLLNQLDLYSDDSSTDDSGENDAQQYLAEAKENNFAISDDQEGEDSVTDKDDTDETEQHLSSEDELFDLLNQYNTEESFDDNKFLSELINDASDDIQDLDNHVDLDKKLSEMTGKESDSESDNGIQYITQDDDSKSSKKKKIKKSKKKETSAGKGFLSKLFGASNDDNGENAEKTTDEQTGKEKAAAMKTEKKKKKKTDKKQAKKLNEEGQNPDLDNQDDEQKKDKKTGNKKKDKKTKKEKKKKEPVEVVEEIDEGHVSGIGITIVFAFFAILVALLMVTTKSFTYSQNVKNASNDFARKRYTQAYNKIDGLELKDEDVELYDKILTVMYVNKQLDSYRNYYQIRMYPEALDSLLKGLKQYNKYIEMATMLGIKEDMDYVKNQIVDELYNVFSLTEENAHEILNYKDQVKYSKAIYDVVSKTFSIY